MKVFHCERCGQVLFFENSQCVSCSAGQAFVPARGQMVALPDDPAAYRLCRNYTEYQTCNWAIGDGDEHQYCVSCRLTRVIPDVTKPEYHVGWYRLEVAKRRLVFTLVGLGLPLLNRDEDPDGGLAFEFKSDPDAPAPPVLTGHADGVITINIAEADDAERERRRTNLNEPYRTLLGHMRHESGHYYWDRLVRDSPEIEAYRELFGDERLDYATALNRYYQTGAPADWQNRFISAYASAHSWEDWAETWAHYLHMVDALETAADNGLVLKPRRPDEPALPRLPATVTAGKIPFDRLIESWISLTYVLNNLNRSLGLQDGYPFVLSTPAIDKLRFVHEVIGNAAGVTPGGTSRKSQVASQPTAVASRESESQAKTREPRAESRLRRETSLPAESRADRRRS